jgi:hypothetical protein
MIHEGDEMNVELAVLADYAADTRDGKLVIAGLFDRIAPPTLPWHHPSMAMALRIHLHPGEEGQHKVRIRLVDPDGREIVSLDAEMNVDFIEPVNGTNSQMVLQMNGLPFEKHGQHSFDVFLDGRYESSAALEIIMPKPGD